MKNKTIQNKILIEGIEDMKRILQLVERAEQVQTEKIKVKPESEYSQAMTIKVVNIKNNNEEQKK